LDICDICINDFLVIEELINWSLHNFFKFEIFWNPFDTPIDTDISW
jgi:hypothetical protein